MFDTRRKRDRYKRKVLRRTMRGGGGGGGWWGSGRQKSALAKQRRAARIQERRPGQETERKSNLAKRVQQEKDNAISRRQQKAEAKSLRRAQAVERGKSISANERKKARMGRTERKEAKRVQKETRKKKRENWEKTNAGKKAVATRRAKEAERKKAKKEKDRKKAEEARRKRAAAEEQRRKDKKSTDWGNIAGSLFGALGQLGAAAIMAAATIASALIGAAAQLGAAAMNALGNALKGLFDALSGDGSGGPGSAGIDPAPIMDTPFMDSPPIDFATVADPLEEPTPEDQPKAPDLNGDSNSCHNLVDYFTKLCIYQYNRRVANDAPYPDNVSLEGNESDVNKVKGSYGKELVKNFYKNPSFGYIKEHSENLVLYFANETQFLFGYFINSAKYVDECFNDPQTFANKYQSTETIGSIIFTESSTLSVSGVNSYRKAAPVALSTTPIKGGTRSRRPQGIRGSFKFRKRMS
jgi:hypothetical protein